MKLVPNLIVLLFLFSAVTHADDIFEQSYELQVHDGPWNSIGAGTGDFNDDGYPDVVASYSRVNDDDYYLYTFLGKGDCSFDAFTTNIFTYPLGSISVNDFNGDGYDDLLIGEGYGDLLTGTVVKDDTIHLLEGNGDGTFAETGTLIAGNSWITSGDLNDDGDIDIVVSNSSTYDPDSVAIGLGNVDFSFQPLTQYPISGLHTVQILGDMNSDGFVDIGILGNDVLFLYGNGDGTLQPAVNVAGFSCGPNTCFIAPGDFDGDGSQDFVATCGDISTDYDIVYVWNGSQYFDTDHLTSMGTWVEVRDYNLDSLLDIALSLSAAPACLFTGFGDGTFASPQPITLETTQALISADFDLDGDYDVAFCEGYYSSQQYFRCYRNTTIASGVEEDIVNEQSTLSIYASPNPFSSSVTIEAPGSPTGDTSLQIFDLSGRLVTELEASCDGSLYFWDGRFSSGAETPIGVYAIKLRTDNSTCSSMVLKLE